MLVPQRGRDSKYRPPIIIKCWCSSTDLAILNPVQNFIPHHGTDVTNSIITFYIKFIIERHASAHITKKKTHWKSFLIPAQSDHCDKRQKDILLSCEGQGKKIIYQVKSYITLPKLDGHVIWFNNAFLNPQLISRLMPISRGREPLRKNRSKTQVARQGPWLLSYLPFKINPKPSSLQEWGEEYHPFK